MNNKKGFTLIEMLMVISLVSLLASIVVVAVGNATDKAKIASTQQFAASVSGQLRDNIVAIWTFNDTTNLGKDSWEGKNNGTLGNGTCTPGNGSCPTVVSGGGISGNALSFDGGDYIDAGNNSSLQITGGLTLAAWVKPNTLSSTGCIIGKNNAWYIHMHSGSQLGRVMMGVTGVSGTNIFSNNAVPIGQWTYVVGVYDKTTLKIYFNGVEQTGVIPRPVPSSLNNPSTNVIIGALTTTAQLFNGSIDEVQIFNAALTAQEVQQRYAESAPRHGMAVK